MKYIFIKSTIFLIIFAQTTCAQTCKDTIPTSTDGHFVDNGNGTITDISTSLIWKKCSEGQSWNKHTNDCDQTAKDSTWEKALLFAKNPDEKLGQYHWRIPNIKELYSLIEVSCYNPSINLNFFPNTSSDFYWSSSPHATNDKEVWTLSFHKGEDNTESKDSFAKRRLVADL